MKNLIVLFSLCAALYAEELQYPIHYSPDLDTQQVVFSKAMKIARDLRRERLAAVSEKTEATLARIIDRAEKELKKRGHDKLAAKIRAEYEADYRPR